MWLILFTRLLKLLGILLDSYLGPVEPGTTVASYGPTTQNHFENKVHNYLQQDVKAGRITRTEQLNKFGDDMEYVYNYDKTKYVNVEWMDNCVNKNCGGCGCGFNLELCEEYPYVSSDITAQRLDNNLHHYIDNIIPMFVNFNFYNK